MGTEVGTGVKGKGKYKYRPADGGWVSDDRPQIKIGRMSTFSLRLTFEFYSNVYVPSIKPLETSLLQPGSNLGYFILRTPGLS